MSRPAQESLCGGKSRFTRTRMNRGEDAVHLCLHEVHTYRHCSRRRKQLVNMANQMNSKPELAAKVIEHRKNSHLSRALVESRHARSVDGSISRSFSVY
jgi:hypothetical protein